MYESLYSMAESKPIHMVTQTIHITFVKDRK